MDVENGAVMERLGMLNRDELLLRLRADFEKTIREVADAVNAAADGHLIDGSEEQVRDLLGDFRQRVFEQAVQMRVEATGASPAFSPSEERVAPSRDRDKDGSQLQRPDRGASSSVSGRRRAGPQRDR
jgi:hypothetical protein